MLHPYANNKNGLHGRFMGSTKSISRVKRSSIERGKVPRSVITAMKGRNDSEKQKKESPKRKKIRIAEEITEANMDKLAAAFDELARKEGFDASLSHFADDATFEDDFDDDDFDDDDNDDDYFDTADDNVDEGILAGSESTPAVNSDDALLDPLKFQLSDFAEDDDDVSSIDNGDDDIDASFENEEDDSMEARINAARRDMVTGRVAVPKQLDQYATETKIDLSSIGLRPEEDPWGIDELPSKKQHGGPKKEYQLVSNAMVCTACGADFQSSKETRPGFLPPEKFEIQVKLSKLEELQRLQSKAENKDAEWTPEDEVEWLIQSAGDKMGTSAVSAAANIDIAAAAVEMGLDLEEIAKKKIICKRCHGLQFFGKVDDVLRPGWTEEPLLSQEKFRELLRPIREKPAVIIALVDLFDFSGSVLPELDNIAGDNPVILVANKADLLPAKMGQVRAENWVRRELEYLGVRSLANIGGAVRLVSCKTGIGVNAMLNKARGLANEMDCDIYVVGAANAGKSTLLNYILGADDADDDDEGRDGRKLRAGNRNKRKSAVTTSPLPGTTLKFIQVDVGGGRSLYDTPGLLVPGTLTQLLTPDELKIVIPKK
jgi:50S ribosome-binding GTPase